MRELEYPFDGKMILRKRKAIRKKLSGQPGLTEKRIAILGGSTTHDVREILELFLMNYGIRPVFYESEYAQYWQDVMFDQEALVSFAPQLVYIHTSCRNIMAFPDFACTKQEAEQLLDRQYQHFEVMWEKLEKQYHCPVIQNNFEYPFFRLCGNQDAVRPDGRVRFVAELNRKFSAYAENHSQFFINDINYQSADYGLREWSDPYYWYMYKYALCPEAVPALAFQLANMIRSLSGKNKKALALDLDNTLWGGIVGDDGADNLELGRETPQGEAYTEFQQYLKELKNRGVLLNVLSKNDRENALAGMEHPQMILKPDDFVEIRADWEPKSQNLLRMAEDLSLLAESFVFVDDNPAERTLVRQQAPDAAVAEMIRPEHYICAIDRAGYFETTYVSTEDTKRTDMYRDNRKRATMRQSCASYEEYLLSLQMRAHIKPFEPVYLARIAQLTNKSNQFNLTTRRYTLDEITQTASSDRYLTLYGRLEDCFGDNGIVSVIIGEKNGGTLDIILWLMSCRVLKRDMEYAMMDTLARQCEESGIRRICGYYYPTAKNGMVKEFYKTMGFEKISGDDKGNTVWELVPGRGYTPKNRVIRMM